VKPQPDRRNWKVLDRRFQFGLAVRLLFAAILFFLAGLVLTFSPSFYRMAVSDDPAVLQKAAEEFLILHERIWPAVLCCFAGVFAGCLVLSHRIAGPVHRINRVLEQLVQGEPAQQVRFRKHDWFQTTADLLNQLIRKLGGTP